MNRQAVHVVKPSHIYLKPTKQSVIFKESDLIPKLHIGVGSEADSLKLHSTVTEI